MHKSVTINLNSSESDHQKVLSYKTCSKNYEKKKRTSITWDVLQADKEKKYMFPNNLAQKTKKIYIFLSLLCQLLFDWLSLKVFCETRLYCHTNIDNVPVTRQKPALCSIGCASKTGISFPEYLGVYYLQLNSRHHTKMK